MPENASEAENQSRAYLGNTHFIDEILMAFFKKIEAKLEKWQKEGVAGEVAQKFVTDSVQEISQIFRGENPDFILMPSWNGEPLALWLAENADLPLPENQQGLDVINAYFTVLTATFMQGWQAYQSGKIDADQWQDWQGAMRRKMCLQLIGTPG
ncbi:hypothetical protein FAI40_08835 [Acetobacteraceae bacterium]|nr:hypothetical protein FAI40_08835 [Acetobacteraceae bacterium]